MITLLVRVPIFNCGVLFVGDCDNVDAMDAVYRCKGKRTRCELSGENLGSVRIVNGDVIVWVRDLEYGSHVVHELTHAACSIMESRNIPQCRETEEVMCYLVQWLKIHVMDKVYDKRARVAQLKEEVK